MQQVVIVNRFYLIFFSLHRPCLMRCWWTKFHRLILFSNSSETDWEWIHFYSCALNIDIFQFYSLSFSSLASLQFQSMRLNRFSLNFTFMHLWNLGFRTDEAVCSRCAHVCVCERIYKVRCGSHTIPENRKIRLRKQQQKQSLIYARLGLWPIAQRSCGCVCVCVYLKICALGCRSVDRSVRKPLL